MFQDITLEELRALQQQKKITIIDVRSESEYEDATIPGSMNIPLFSDQERAEVGTLYKQTSIKAAKERGLEIVSAKLPTFIRQFGEIEGKKAVFCWRGGMRSRTTATVLSLMDVHAYRLIGGFRTYRKWVVETLAQYELKPKPLVLHGNTGTGKTALLNQLKQTGYPVLNLEELASHRGSIFGHIGLKANNQKTFEALLVEELLRYENEPYLLFEAESKRIGKVYLPDFLMRAKEEGQPIWIELPLEARVKQIIADYDPASHQQEYEVAFNQIKRRLHTPIAAEIEGCLKDGRYEQAVRMLLVHYYDPRYAHTADQYTSNPREAKIEAKDVADAYEQLTAMLKQQA